MFSPWCSAGVEKVLSKSGLSWLNFSWSFGYRALAFVRALWQLLLAFPGCLRLPSLRESRQKENPSPGCSLGPKSPPSPLHSLKYSWVQGSQSSSTGRVEKTRSAPPSLGKPLCSYFIISFFLLTLDLFVSGFFVFCFLAS